MLSDGETRSTAGSVKQNRRVVGSLGLRTRCNRLSGRRLSKVEQQCRNAARALLCECESSLTRVQRPLLHYYPDKMSFNESFSKAYDEVNQHFADILASHVQDNNQMDS